MQENKKEQLARKFANELIIVDLVTFSFTGCLITVINQN